MLITTLSASVAHASLKDAMKVFKSGNWTVLRHTDPMKDTVNCTGIHKENYGIQLTEDSLYVSIRGGIQSVTLRFDDNPARSMRLADDIEKKINSVIISGTDFTELVSSNRLRVQVSTLVRGIANEDLDLTGIQSTLENIKAKCPAQKEEVKPAAVPLAPVSSAALTSCSTELKARMKAQGIKDKQIEAICK
ncbi:hypothetical protein D3871_11400 [Noviherbaspirillum saxi]|uniref:Uncharacterized protein n=2 Tax=Noviherbaspirillum saxi TaxID=2320863 RepID=A0A3A3FU34_9BURK|nr:hypothetical protein D3871_11400 [Noviherbaspirillum saxi]